MTETTKSDREMTELERLEAYGFACCGCGRLAWLPGTCDACEEAAS